MCLWYGLFCLACRELEPVAFPESRICNNPGCRRRGLDPTQLTWKDKLFYVKDAPCRDIHCLPEQCGLTVRVTAKCSSPYCAHK